jgi:flagellar hook assembly protein FlgD
MVYDVLGRKVWGLVNEPNDAGWHTLIWDGRDDSGRRVPSGTYFLRLEGGEYTATRKLCVVR